MSYQEWDFDAEYSTKLTLVDGLVFDAENDRELPELAEYVTGPTELTFHFNVKGYADSGSRYGGQDHLGWAPESDENRTMLLVVLNNNKKLPKELQTKLFDLYAKQIDGMKLNYDRD